MKIRIHINKLFRKYSEGENPSCIIGYSKIPIYDYANYNKRTLKANAFRYKIYINLWLIEFKFKFKKNIKYDKDKHQTTISK